MAAHRYWRIEITANNGDSTGHAIAECRFYDQTDTLVSMSGATYSSSSNYGANYTPDKAFDGSVTGFVWLSNGVSGTQWIEVDFGSGNEKDIRWMELISERNLPNRGPRSFSLRYSDDGSTWTTLWDNSGDLVSGWRNSTGDTPFYRFGLAPAKTIWRIRTDETFLTSRTNVALAELEMALTASGSDVTAAGQPSYSTTTFSTNNTAALFDGNTGNFWASNSNPTALAPEYLYVMFSSPQDIQEIRMRSRNDSFHDQAPCIGAVHYWNGSGWTEALQFDLTADGSSAGQVHTLTIIPVAIDSVLPNNGPLAGGTPVTISGEGFSTATAVLFDTDPADNFFVVDNETITCETPAHAAGVVDVTVQRSNGDLVKPAAFTYSAIPEPSVDNYSPKVGPVGGGTEITFTGEDLDSVTDVTFGGLSADNLSVGPTTITCDTPAQSASGPVDVVLENPVSNVLIEDGFTYVGETRLTQAPVMVVYNPFPEVRATQIPVLVINVPVQGALVTQVPVLTLWNPTPIPLPLPIVPEVPVTETWSYLTTVNIAEGSREQRSSLRENPRVSIGFSALILSDLDRYDAYQMLFKYIKQDFDYPNYVYSTKLNAASSQGSTSLSFNSAFTDLRDGDVAALFDMHLEVVEFVTVDEVEADGCTLIEPLSRDIPAYWHVCPVSRYRIKGGAGLSMDSVSGNFELALETVKGRPVVRPLSVSPITTYDGLPLLDKVPLADRSVDENFDQNVVLLDNETSVAELRASWPVPFIGGRKSFLVHRPGGMDYWRHFADTVQGRQKSFLMPTFRNDLPLVNNPAIGSAVLLSSNIQFFDFWRERTYQYVYIRRKNGTVVYRRILEVTANYDPSGQPLSINVTLNSVIGNNAAGVDIDLVSFLNRCRLNSDEINVEHFEVDSYVTLEIRTVNE